MAFSEYLNFNSVFDHQLCSLNFFSVKTRVLKNEKLFYHIVILVALTLRHSHFGSKMAGQYPAESLRDYYVKDGIHRC